MMCVKRVFPASLLCALASSLVLGTPAIAVGDATAAECPPATESSPGFRSYLPDCRAYELVTPPYTGGQGLKTNEGLPMSPDGQHLLGLDYAGFAGGENDEQNGLEFGARYGFSRTPLSPSCVGAARECWSTESLEPPASLAAHRSFVGASADLSRSLWKLSVQGSPGEEIENPVRARYSLSIRETAADGTANFSEVGPAYAPGQGEAGPGGELELGFEAALGYPEWGASRDLSHIVLGVGVRSLGHHRLWPGDNTAEGHQSLYEYVGTGNREPSLVGVKNAGPLEGTTHVNEHAELVSECGTVLGAAGEASVYNAVSASGTTVYFTAQHEEGCPASQPPVNEIYARIAGSRTVAISEPTTGPGGDCSACKAGAPSDAVFQGASEDGSKVFFLSERALLPGAKGENLYEYDFGAAPGARVALVAPEAPGVARISEDGTHVYFASRAALTATNPEGEAPEEAAYNLYVFDTTTNRTSFVADLLTKGEAEGLGAGEAESRTGVTLRDVQRPFEATPDGRFLVFTSARRLTNDDRSTVGQVFEYDTATERLTRVSAGLKGSYLCRSSGKLEEGFNCNGNTTDSADAARILAPAYSQSLVPTQAASGLSVSVSGSVFFMSFAALTPQAVEGGENVYEYRAGNVELISPGDEAAPAQSGPTVLQRLLGTDASGSDVFVLTTNQLVPQDTDTQASWYDARENGGFPGPPSPAACEADGCHGPLSAPFATPMGGSEATSGEASQARVAPKISTPAPRPLTRAQKLTAALKKCGKKKPIKARRACTKQARKKYGPKSRAASGDRRTK